MKSRQDGQSPQKRNESLGHQQAVNLKLPVTNLEVGAARFGKGTRQVLPQPTQQPVMRLQHLELASRDDIGKRGNHQAMKNLETRHPARTRTKQKRRPLQPQN